MSTYTPSLGLELITPGSQAGLWGNTTNNSLNLIDQAITGVTPISFAAASGTTQVLTDDNGAANQSRAAVLNITGSATGANTIVIPNKEKTYLVRNNTSQDVVFQTPTPSASYTVGAGYSILVFCDGNNNVFTGIASPGVGTLSVNAGGTGSTTFNAGFVKSTGGTNALTSASTVNAATELSGVTPVVNGGTGASSLTSGALLFGNGTGAMGALVGGAVGQVPTWNGSGWSSAAPPGGVSTVSGGTGISASGTTNVTLTNTGVTSISAGSGITVSGSTGAVTISSSASSGVASFSAGTTGFTPSSSSTGAVVLGGTLGVANGGTGANTLAGAGIVTTTGTQTIGGSKTFSSTVVINGGNLSVYGDPSGTYALLFGASTASPFIAANAAGSVMNFQVQNQTRLSVNSSGVVFSGTATCTAWNMAASTSMYLSGGVIYWAINNGTVMNIDSNGDFRIYGSNAYKASGTTWVNPSDIRIKDDVQSYTKGLQELTQITPKTWTFNGKGGSKAGQKGLGVIADEVESVIPDAVSTYKSKLNSDDAEETDIKNFNADEIIWLLVNSVKELKVEVDNLKSEVAALKAAQ
jgi:hypothetical protein